MRRVLRVMGWSVLALGVGSLTEGAEFIPLGTLRPGHTMSVANDISADGQTVVGISRVADNVLGGESFRWTRAVGMVGLGDLPDGGVFGAAEAVSADGSQIAGWSTSPLGFEPYRWTEGKGMVGLGGFPGERIDGAVQGMSASGHVLVGSSINTRGGRDPFRWTQETGLQRLGSLVQGFATDVSGDGNVIVGDADHDGISKAFRWTVEEGYEFLGRSPSVATAISADGLTIVGGTSTTHGPDEAFRWTKSEGMMPLTWQGRGGLAYDVSSDGSVIVGGIDFGGGTSGQRAFFWTEAGGVRLLDDWLRQGGSLAGQLQEWRIIAATGVSDNGLSLVGYGKNPSGNYEAFLVVVPEPDGAVLLVLGLFWTVSFVRRKPVCLRRHAMQAPGCSE